MKFKILFNTGKKRKNAVTVKHPAQRRALDTTA